ncbi:signal transduction histidine kinase [Novosphingobium sp. PhB165]|uniref:sensor histidine kinase n=1 Tax=Novosphingobium sp. PhB165 TaxID=2485105 RepID=UPI0010ED2DBF|nr:HAMP domain-containing sensor histidine kinase [Novosphingobium sp. PhB165]TCM20850.1 signal transduction histidine kinase [Novosphingobium sp. PhB165]
MRTPSVLRRILVLHAAATLITAVFAALGAWLLIDSTGDRLQRQVLDEYAQKMQAGLERHSKGWTISEEAAVALRGGGSSFSFWVEDRGRRIAVDNLKSSPSLAVPTRPDVTYFRRVRGSKIYSGISMPLVREPGSWLVIVQNLDHPDVIFDDLRAQIVMVGGGLLAIFLVGLLTVDTYIVRQSLAPVKRASREVEQVFPHQLQQRVDTEGMPEEVLPLLRAFNAALDRVEDAYRIEREFAADAAHELRTPLAILRLLAGQGGPSEVQMRMLRQIDVVEAIVERLLLVAEVDAMACDPEEMVELRSVVEDRVAAIVPLLMAKGQVVEIVGLPRMEVFASEYLVGRVLDSLLENAAKHTLPGTRVTVAVGPGSEVHVADTGPGLPTYDPQIFARFEAARRDLSRSSGLGLAIASELMRKVGGKLESRANVPNGVIFTLRFRSV